MTDKILAGGGDDHVNGGKPGGVERADLTGVGHHPGDVELTLEPGHQLGILFDDQDVVAPFV